MLSSNFCNSSAFEQLRAGEEGFSIGILEKGGVFRRELHMPTQDFATAQRQDE